MELQEILGCLGNVEKLDALPLSTLKAAAKKYPYISQLKMLLLKKEMNPQDLKEHLLSTTDLTPSLELKSELKLEHRDPSLLIKIVKKETNKPKKAAKTLLNLKKEKIVTSEERLTLVTSKDKSNTTQKAKASTIKTTNVAAKTTAPSVTKTNTKAPTIASKPKVTSTAKTQRTTSRTRNKKKSRSSDDKRMHIQTNLAPPKKRRYTRRKSTPAKQIQVSPINPPLPEWKDILSQVVIKKSPSTKAPKPTKRRTVKAKSPITRAKAAATTSKIKKVATPVISQKKQKKSSTKSTLALSQNKKTASKAAAKSDKKSKNATKKQKAISSKKARLKFSEWLNEKNKKSSKKPKKKSSKTKPKNELKRLVKSSVVKKEEIATVTLAKLYTKQGHFKKAIKVYDRLRLLNPEKSSFFASKIRKLKQK